ALEAEPGARVGEPGGEEGVATDVVALLTHLADGAHDHVVHERRIEVVPLHESLEGDGGQIDGVNVLEDPVATPDGGPHGVDDYGISHDAPFSSEPIKEPPLKPTGSVSPRRPVPRLR